VIAIRSPSWENKKDGVYEVVLGWGGIGGRKAAAGGRPHEEGTKQTKLTLVPGIVIGNRGREK